MRNLNMARQALASLLFGLALITLTLAATATPVAAQGGDDFVLPPGVTWDAVNKIASKMYCDVCEGIPLDECESVACRQWREEIARQLADGRNQDEIMDYFVERYGADVASLPRSTTDRILTFAVPIGIALALGIVGYVQMRQMRQRGRRSGQVARRSGTGRLQARPVPDDLDPALIERLERELEGLES